MKKFVKLLSLSALVALTGCNSVLDAPTEAQKPITQIAHNDPQWQNTWRN